MRVAAKLIGFRNKAQMSQGQVARRMGLSQSAVSKIEKKTDRNLRIGEVRDYARVVGMQLVIDFAQQEPTCLPRSQKDLPTMTAERE